MLSVAIEKSTDLQNLELPTLAARRLLNPGRKKRKSEEILGRPAVSDCFLQAASLFSKVFELGRLSGRNMRDLWKVQACRRGGKFLPEALGFGFCWCDLRSCSIPLFIHLRMDLMDTLLFPSLENARKYTVNKTTVNNFQELPFHRHPFRSLPIYLAMRQRIPQDPSVGSFSWFFQTDQRGDVLAKRLWCMTHGHLTTLPQEISFGDQGSNPSQKYAKMPSAAPCPHAFRELSSQHSGWSGEPKHLAI